MRRGRYLDKVAVVSGNTIGMYASCGTDNGVSFCSMVRAIPEGGKVYTLGENLIVEEANTVTILISAATSYFHLEYEKQCLKYLDHAAYKNYSQLLCEHTADYSSL